MDSRFEIVNSKKYPFDSNEAKAALDQFRKSGSQLSENELEKNSTDLKVITCAEELIKKELISLGIQEKEFLPLERIHLVPGETLTKGKTAGNYNVGKQSVEIGKDPLPQPSRKEFLRGLLSFEVAYLIEPKITKKEKLLNTTIHEFVHHQGHQEIQFIGREDRWNVTNKREGYSIYNKNNTEKQHHHFLGFNEAVVQKITNEIMDKNRAFIYENLDSLEFGTEPVKSSYSDEIAILDLVIEGVAFSTEKSPEIVWESIKKNEFTGNLMHLRAIEKTYGPGSLRILSWMNSDQEVFESEAAVNDYRNYFNIHKNNTVREEAKKNILSRINNTELLAYEKHKDLLM